MADPIPLHTPDGSFDLVRRGDEFFLSVAHMASVYEVDGAAEADRVRSNPIFDPARIEVDGVLCLRSDYCAGWLVTLDATAVPNKDVRAAIVEWQRGAVSRAAGDVSLIVTREEPATVIPFPVRPR